VCSESVHALEALQLARKQSMISPVLFGNKEKTLAALSQIGADHTQFSIYECTTPEQAVDKAIAHIQDGQADFIMKGQVETGVMMKRMLKNENGFRTGTVVHSVTFAEIETYHKLLALTDAAILIAPTLEQKRMMIENTVSAMKKMGWDCPKVAVLAAIENVNPDIPGSVDAAELKQLWQAGKIHDCVIEGPIAFDLAISRESAELKGFKSTVAGDADLVIYPDINAGNISLKTITMTGRNKTGSVVLGLKAPVIVTSRGSSMENKFRSLLLASAMA